ncbi:uncharacterized protein EKO05_0000925 [Ascochyta rabiei]|uniref:Hydrolase n=1 Tax=Didymella rabiei TaxID=5454 RepID=A0A163ELN7_DIDRA|nr:uncharacterized protein EKO05_0000925 [Ascochyta rabiei]KZM23763.1 hydrolase [Ascochyta rabiei]UPX10258.1 hypothetical protein EKO05_0000925 [Ascochyta rabiei]
MRNFFLSLTSVDPEHTNFTTVASSLSCNNLNATAEIDCLRAVPFTEIISFLKTRLCPDTVQSAIRSGK